MKYRPALRLLSRVLLFVSTFCGVLFAQNTQAQFNRSLGLLTPGVECSLRLRDNQVIAEVQLISVDEKSLSYKREAMLVKIERELVFRAYQNGLFYSDLPLTTEDHQKFNDYVAYIQERGDTIVDVDHNQYVGTIVSESDSGLTIRTRAASYEVEKRKVAAWRKDGVWYGDADAREEPSSSIFGMKSYLDKKRTLNYALMLSGPWSVLPQFGAGIGTNVNWPLFAGVRGSAGYIWVDTNAMGFLMQTSAYLNVNLVNFGASRLFAGTSYIWRAGMVMDYEYGGSASSYRGNRIYGVLTQNTYSLHLGLKYKNLMFEGGVEMPITFKQDFHRPVNSTVTDQAEIERGVGRVQSSLDTFEKISRVYANVSLMF
jgi:hypothetical protein